MDYIDNESKKHLNSCKCNLFFNVSVETPLVFINPLPSSHGALPVLNFPDLKIIYILQDFFGLFKMDSVKIYPFFSNLVRSFLLSFCSDIFVIICFFYLFWIIIIYICTVHLYILTYLYCSTYCYQNHYCSITHCVFTDYI